MTLNLTNFKGQERDVKEISRVILRELRVYRPGGGTSRHGTPTHRLYRYLTARHTEGQNQTIERNGTAL